MTSNGILRTAATLIILVMNPFGRTIAQDYLLGTVNIVDCGGLIYDTGGPGGGGYGLNQQATTTVCPEAAGSSVALNFLLFQLDTQGPAPLDHLAIHDGPSTASPLLGVFQAGSLQGQVVRASAFNTSGCLTLRFTSNAQGTGFLAASIACGPPCSAPTAAFTPLTDTLRLCPGTPLAVDASLSQAAPGRSLARYEWTLSGAPPTISTTPLDTLTFEASGAYRLWLRAMDDLGCPSVATEPRLVLVAAPPSFAGTTAPEAVCAPATFALQGQATSFPLGLAGSVCIDLGQGTLLPDDVGAPIEFTINNTAGLPGQVVGNATELGDICLTMEHSFMGDLLIELECPNGQSVMLHQQGGGGTFLGEANDMDLGAGQNAGPGLCYTYCFSATPDHGTWVECSQFGATPNVQDLGFGAVLLPGTYTPVEPLSQLVGCPVNGTWTMRFTDLWAADNGYLCSWCTGYENHADSGLASLSPTFDLLTATSAFWSGSNVNDLPDGPNATATLNTTVVGSYSFTVIDNYGCTYDTTLVVHGTPPPVVDAGTDVLLCADSAQLAVAVDPLPVVGCTYTLVLTSIFEAGWYDASITVLTSGTTMVYTLAAGGDSTTIALNVVQSGSLSLLYNEPNNFFLPNRFLLYDHTGALLYDSGTDPDPGQTFSMAVDCGAPDLSAVVQWTPAIGLSDPTSPFPQLFTATSGWYTVAVIPAALPGCVGTDSLWVESDATSMELIFNGSDSSLCASIDTLSSYAWWYNGTLHSTTTEPCLTDPSEGAWYVVGTGASACPYVTGTTLLCPSLTLIESNGILVAQGATGTWVWTYNGAVISGATGPFATLLGSGNYVATVTTAAGCVVSTSLTIDSATNVNSPNAGAAMRVFPVPTSGTLRVQAQELQGPQVQLTLMDLSGRTVHQAVAVLKNGRIDHTLELVLPAGSYVLHLWDGEGTHTARVVVE